MRPDKFKLANEWIYGEATPMEEAKATWEAMDAEFNENRKIMLAESDAYKDNFNTPDLEQSPDSFLRPKRIDIFGNVIPAETLEDFDVTFRRPNAEGGMQQLVQPSGDGSRPGYSGDYTEEEKIKQKRIYKIKDGKKTLDLNKEQKKWFNKTHKNNPNSRYYKKDWDDLGGKKSDILDSYFNELKREKPPKGYITTKEFSQKYDFPIYEKRQYGPVTKAESNFINNALMKTIGEKEASKGRKNLFLKKFLNDVLEPKQFTVLKDLGDGKKSAGKINYVKDNAALAKKVRTYIDSPSIDPKTIENMKLVLKNNKIKNLFNKGDYKGIVKALATVKNLTDSERANVMLRIAQAMDGVNFRDFDHNVSKNKLSAKKIFQGLETGRGGVPREYTDAYKRLKYNTIKDAIGEQYFTKSYQGFIDDSRAALKKAGIDIVNIDLNEITGLSSGYKNQTFSSTQFVNFMDSAFNQGAHASMIGEYNRYENALQTALKKGTVNFKGETFTPRQLISNWQEWRGDWFNRLDDKYKTKAVKDILPSFKLGKDPYSFMGKKRLSELLDQGLDLSGEGVKAGYAKTFPNIKTAPILKEVPKLESQQLKNILIDFEKYGCGNAAGGRILFATGSPFGKVTKCADKGIARFLNDIKTGNYTETTKKLFRGGANLIKSTLNPMELLKLRNYFGPAALGFMAAFEGGVIADDVFRMGQPLNESLASNWLTKSFTPYSLKHAEISNLIKSNKLPSNMLQYAKDAVKFEEAKKEMQRIEELQGTRVIDESGYGFIDGTSVYTKEQEAKDVKGLTEKLSSIKDGSVIMPGSAKEMELQKQLTEKSATEMAKKGFSPFFGFGGLKDRNQEVVFDDYMSPVEMPKDLRPRTYLDAVEYKNQPLPASERIKYENFFSSPEGGNYLKPKQSLSELKYKDTNILDELTKEYNQAQRIKLASELPGFYGTQDDREFMEGGIASLNVKK